MHVEGARLTGDRTEARAQVEVLQQTVSANNPTMERIRVEGQQLVRDKAAAEERLPRLVCEVQNRAKE